ncbi:hypothetical protein B7494_g4373 [Chlorociboria aeruginascens]|nr:hypothetical protein B7494_g4373 [Chlorociboria aeruginascens]
MDLMDYTMDNAQLPPQREPSCPYLQSQHPSNNYAHQPRDSHRYDPVHGAEAWYHATPPNRHPMSSYGPLNLPWPPSHFSPAQSWNRSGGETNLGRLGLDPASPFMNRAHPGFPGDSPSPWASAANYEPLPFGYSSFNGIAGDNNGPSESNPNNRNSAPVSTTAVNQTQLRFSPGLMDEYLRSPNRGHSTSNTSSGNQVDRPDGQMQASMLQVSHVALREDRTQIQARLRQRISATIGAEDARRHRHLSGPSSSRLIDDAYLDDDGDDSSDLSREDIEIYHRHSDAVFGSGILHDPTMPGFRGSRAASKKIPSKEAMASLETVNPKDLPESDKICIICYNELGVENPEGVVEAPLRLPKCKHIFGEKCIKKWFEDCDSCPYCRDKLPSDSPAVKRVGSVGQFRYRQVITRDPSNRSQPRVSETSGNGRSSELSHLRQSQDELNFFISSRATEPWFYTPTNHRPFPTESTPEARRRLARGRVGYGRAIYSGRPMSVGSTRPTIQGAASHLSSQRPNGHAANGQESDLAIHPPRRSATPGLPSQSGMNSVTFAEAPTITEDRMVNFRGGFSDYHHWPMSPFSVNSSSGVGAFANAISSTPPNPVAHRDLFNADMSTPRWRFGLHLAVDLMSATLPADGSRIYGPDR